MIDVLDDLCWHDPRNPNAAHCTSTGDEPPEPRKNCACDPCFYGRDRLALEVLSLQSRLAAAEAEAERARGALVEVRRMIESDAYRASITARIDAHLASRPEGEVRHG